jgi:hypothetical protein
MANDMADRKQIRQQFFQRHPRCCFCGGNEPATTEDHQPARSLFDERKWPEGYNFPACSKCNEASRPYENVFALLVRMAPGSDASGVQKAEFQKLLEASANNFPGLLQRMTANDKRRFFREEDLPKPKGVAFSELDMCAVDATLTQDSVMMILQKLSCALHYKHTGSILPKEGRIFIKWITNAYTHRGTGFNEFIGLLQGRPNLVRTTVSLIDQFDYVFATDPSGSSFSAFFCFFRTAFAGYGLAFNSEKLAGYEFHPSELRSPFNWTNSAGPTA